ncbi:MAG: 50S ribosomal protein L22 [Clostridia bacterium]|nr:50S ribosomal protein L22 [Clostridia bacterium]
MATRMKEKSAARIENADKRPKATAKYIRISPYKVRIVLDIIRGKNYTEAAAILKNTNKSAAPVVLKVLDSAAANAEYKNISKSDLFVAEAFADQGPTLKRIMPRAKGRAYRILKRTSHITVILDSANN